MRIELDIPSDIRLAGLHQESSASWRCYIGGFDTLFLQGSRPCPTPEAAFAEALSRFRTHRPTPPLNLDDLDL